MKSPIRSVLKTIAIFSVILMASVDVPAQENLLRGIVTDGSTQQIIETAAVKLLQGSQERLVDYTLTDHKGMFQLSVGRNTDSLYVAVSLLGYKTHKQAAYPGDNIHIRLESEVFNLREVVIRPGRIWGRQDTINYDVSQFIGNTDESIKDVINKLPGIDVDVDGRISYNGKNISKFYVEGMDLVDGRYNQITKNLQAKSVETVQILDNHQPLRVLKDKIKTEDVAINLKLQPNFRDKWAVYLCAGGGVTSGSPADDVLWLGDMNALQLSRGSQSAYIYKGNNTGNDVTTELMSLINQGSHLLTEPEIPAFLSQPSLEAPLKKERLLFNNVHTASANRMYQLSETAQLRINAGFTHDYRKQQRGSQTTYFQSEDTISIDEESRIRIRSDKANLDINIDDNGENRYLANKFSASGGISKSISDFYNENTFRQLIRTTTSGVKNDLRGLWNKGRYTFELRSLMRYYHSPSELEVHTDRQRLNLNHFYTDNSFSLLKKTANITQRYTSGVALQTSNITNGYNAYFTPSWQIQHDQLQATFTVPIRWTTFNRSDFSRLMANPYLSLEYKYNYAWRFRLYGNFQESYGSITDFYDLPYQTNYRNVIWNSGALSVRRQQVYSVYAEYKNTIKEFFASLSLTRNYGWSNRINERFFRDGQVVLAYQNRSTKSSGWALSGIVSKGIYEWRMKMSLNYQLSTSSSEQLSDGKPVPYKSRHIKITPKINWNPWKPLDVNYESAIGYGGGTIGQSTRLDPLLNVVQQLNLFYTFPFIELGFTADHYYNDVSENKSVNAFLIDASLRWKSGKWQINVAANNLLNKKQYSYTQYSSMQSYTSWINIRGREFHVSARYRF